MKTVAFIIIATLGIIIYFNVVFNGFAGDDEYIIEKNPLVHSITNIPLFFQGSSFYNTSTRELEGQYYRPILLTVYTIIISTFGLKAFFLHLFHLTFYFINAYLVYLLLRIFFNNLLALLLAVLFLVHPINAEIAVPIADIQEVLFFFFGMLALFITIYKNNKTGTILSSVLLFLSILSKETGFLFFVPIFLIILFKPQKNRGSQFIRFSISVTAIIVTYVALRMIFPLTSNTHFNIHAISNAGQILNTLPSIIFFYIKTLFYPKDLSFSHLWIINDITFSNFYIPLIVDLLVTAAILFLGFACWKKRSLFVPFIFFTIWLVSGMLFHLNIFLSLDQIVADRWFYFPFVGLLGLIGVTFALLNISKKRYLVFIFILWLVIVIPLSLRTRARVPDWKDTYTLYTHDLKVEENFILENAFGHWLLRNGKKDEANYYLEKSKRELNEWTESSKK